MERSIVEQQSKIDKIKKDAIDLQGFLSIKSTEAELDKMDKTVNSIINDGEDGLISINFNLDPAIENLALNTNSFGHVTVEINPFLSKSIEEISLDLQKAINTQVKQTEGCCLLDNGKSVFSDFLKDRVTVISENGELDFQIPIKSSLHGLAAIDSQTIAISPGGSAPHCNQGQFANIANFKDKLYVTDRDEHTVTCSDIKGTVLWTFQDTKVLQRPWGITVDKDGNIYVVDWKDKLVVLSDDGIKPPNTLPETLEVDLLVEN
ncbi:unnamed protein product [Mytilus edulis]|uniref:Uncharacterized protein n=1 Tax=Mytilus edulis TaxID=6550 RepID=A0A8S3Q8W0_MYTED|nr:unnamed protein product [Mytilus edulis]